jgi:hypothetical protein
VRVRLAQASLEWRVSVPGVLCVPDKCLPLCEFEVFNVLRSECLGPQSENKMEMLRDGVEMNELRYLEMDWRGRYGFV